MDLSALKELGLSDGQTSVYQAVLELGVGSINKMQEKTGIERRNIYDILNKLIERGLITYNEEKGKRTYQCTHPSKIAEEIAVKRHGLETLEQELPAISQLYAEAKPRVGAQVYRGNEALKALLNEFLEHDRSYWIGGNSGIEFLSLKDWFHHWMVRRVAQGHVMYDLVDSGSSLETLPARDLAKHKKALYKRCELPKDLSSPMVTVIFGDRVAQILWSKQPFAFVLESREIRESFMRYFDYFWTEPW